MQPRDIAKLRALTNFDQLVAYLRDELDWPVEAEDADDYTFDYDPTELGIAPQHAVKIETIKQIRPLADTQPWAVFYIQFESKRLPVVVLRRILRSLVPASRHRDPHQPIWRLNDLLFISAQGDAEHRSISFAHFRRREGRIPELRTFSWDTRETHFYYIKNLNLEALRWPADESDADAWREQWSRAFTVAHRYTITTSQVLARQMARHAATVRDLVNEVYTLETGDGPLHQLYAAFKETLLHDLAPETFADMVAQTVAYGLFSAATQTSDSDDLTYDRMVELIPNTNPFLKDLLAELTAAEAEKPGFSEKTRFLVDLDDLGVGQLVELLRQTNIEAILQDFGKQSGMGREDPVIHFYELFLSEYDREQKTRRGVFYTPKPAVAVIVRSVDYPRRPELGCPEGRGDTSTMKWRDKTWPKVMILDPAVGTGTFLETVIDVIHETMVAKWKKQGKNEVQIRQAWNQYVPKNLLPRLHGFELMMAPYAVAHMKIGLKLKQTGYDFKSGERLRVYLTNALELPRESTGQLQLIPDFLAQEAEAADEIKRSTPITVVVANPPYAVNSANKRSDIDPLLSIYKQGLDDERNLKPLNDDYVKFFRYAHLRIDEAGVGLIGMITNHSYSSARLFRSMRRSLLSVSSPVYFLDLRGEETRDPAMQADKNVFDIQQGVGISLLVFSGDEPIAKPKILIAEQVGSREYKYHWLANHTVQFTNWVTVHPQPPLWSFSHTDLTLRDEYMRFVPVVSLFSTGNVGYQTHRDAFVIDFDPKSLVQRLEAFRSAAADEESLATRFSIRSNRDWSLLQAHSQARADTHIESHLVPTLYRPFDRRYICYASYLIDYDRRGLLEHLLAPNLGLLVSKVFDEHQFTSVFVTRLIVESKVADRTRGSYVFPLYLLDSGSEQFFDRTETDATSVPNLNRDILEQLADTLRVQAVDPKDRSLASSISPEDALHYIYAILHAPTYRSRYLAFLKTDFPRVPLISNTNLFHSLCTLGADLVALHLLEDDYPAASWNQTPPGSGRSPTEPASQSPLQHPITTFVEGTNGTTLGAFSKSKCYEDGKVYLDTSQRSSCSYFDGLPKDVWNFHVGGYQVCRKWLYDRRGKKGVPGRTLTQDDIAHYQRFVVALKETIRLMEEIDQAIESHGGWPIE